MPGTTGGGEVETSGACAANGHRVVILGGGFGGLSAARALARAPVQATLLDRRNFHLFQPLLYQVATGGLSPANIASPLRNILKRQPNVRVLLGEAVGLDPHARRVLLADGEIPYDSLIVALGASHHYFGREEWAELAPGLKTIEDAIELRRRIFTAFERAEREADPSVVEALLTFVVVGAGPTGVELAGAMAEIARDTLAHEFRSIDPARARIILMEGGPRVLPSYPPDLSEKAAQALRRLGVEVRTSAIVTDILPEYLAVRSGERVERILARTVLWAAGVQASPFGRALAETTGATLDRAGRVIVGPDLSLPGHPEILVIGDLAHLADGTGSPLPGVAQVAMQQGAYAARLIRGRLQGGPTPPFRYRDYGTMATIGRNAAVADVFRLRFGGYLAWLAWLGIHLMHLVQFENRVLVLAQWSWSYLTFNRAARLITNLPTVKRKKAEGE
jgi:NADH:ubiquinone reductase (H+-translocating)